MLDTIDVLMTTYNGEKYLQEQIESILNQTYTNIQLIISDDCSQDETKEILKKYKNHPQVKIYYQEHNLGYVKNFEFLIKHVEHNLYMMSDQDDIWLPQKIEKTYKKMCDEKADLVFTDLEIVDENAKTISKSFNKEMKKAHKINKTIGTNKFEYLYNNITGCTILTKKELIDKILPFPENTKYIIHDSWIGLITSFNGKISYLEEPTILYRQHTNNQVGADRHTYQEFNELRNLFIEVKHELFKTYIENQNKFPEELKQLNNSAKTYFEEVSKKKNISFKGWNIFHKLYKYETLSYYILNFIIINLPLIGKTLFGIRKLITKAKEGTNAH